jgi:hypothetical protein
MFIARGGGFEKQETSISPERIGLQETSEHHQPGRAKTGERGLKIRRFGRPDSLWLQGKRQRVALVSQVQTYREKRYNQGSAP